MPARGHACVWLCAGTCACPGMRAARQQLIERAGLQIETPDGNFSVQPRTVTAATVQSDYDLIVLAPKAYDLDDALASLARADMLLPLSSR